MNENGVIPAVVGRLGDVMEAIRAEDWHLVTSLIEQEVDRRDKKLVELRAQVRKEETALGTILAFGDLVYSNETTRAKAIQEVSR